MPKLVISLPDSGEAVHELTEAKVTVGRTDENRIQIDDASISSHHAELVQDGGSYVLKDLGSTNGTYLNGEAVAAGEEHPLSGGDRIRFGNVEAVYETGVAKEKKAAPEAQTAASTPARSSARPADFGSSPFARKSGKTDPVGLVAYILAGVGIIGILVVAAMTAGLPHPQF